MEQVGSRKMPLRPNCKPCRNLEDNGICTYGPKCFFDHPVELIKAAFEKSNPQLKTKPTDGTTTPSLKNAQHEHLNSSAAVLEPVSNEVNKTKPVSDDLGVGSQAPLINRPHDGLHSGPVQLLDGTEIQPRASSVGNSLGGHTLRELLGVVNKIWPPSSHMAPKSWTLSQISQSLLIRAAWRSCKADPTAAGGSTAALPGTVPKGLAATLALASNNGLGGARMTASEVLREAVLLSQVGAELGLMWRKKQVRIVCNVIKLRLGWACN